jgi:hypothetical protein
MRLIILGCIIPFVLSTIVYYGFSTNYTKGVFTKQGFEQLYGNGIYKYRVLGSSMLLKTYDLVEKFNLPILPHNEGDWKFYSAYFYLNTFFLCLTCITLFIVLGGLINNDFMAVDLPLMFMCCLMTITQYVVVPYDTLSYFFLSIAAFLILKNKQKVWEIIILSIVVILATLTRETASLILAFYFAFNYKEILKKTELFKINQKQRELLIITLCFLCTYFGLRFALGFENGIYKEITLINITNILSILSILFFVSIFILIVITKVKTKETFIFLLATLPYTLALLAISILWEIRLWVPVILLLLILKIPRSINSPSSGMDNLSKIEDSLN